MLKEFKEFIARGNVIDLAVAVVIGAAFGRIVTSLVEGVIMPPIGLLLGQGRFFKPLHRSFGSESGIACRCSVERTAGHRVRQVFQRHHQFSNHCVGYFPDHQSGQPSACRTATTAKH